MPHWKASSPARGVLGIQWSDDNRRKGVELSTSFVSSKSDNQVQQEDAFLPDSYNMIDLTLFYKLNAHFQVNLGGFNLTDETYYLWSDVRGRSAASPTITRFSAPGRSLSLNLRYHW